MSDHAAVIYTALEDYISSNWSRSALTALQVAPPPDPSAHGHDEVCPIDIWGTSFDPANEAAVAPFTPAQIAEQVGYVTWGIVPAGDAASGVEVVIPGPDEKECIADLVTYFDIFIPAGRGPLRALQYAGALNGMAYRYESASSSDVICVRVDESLGFPEPQGNSGDFDRYQSGLRLEIQFIARS